MSRLIKWLDGALYAEFSDHWDDDLFRSRVLPHLDGRSTVLLDVGAGAGILPQMDFRGSARHVCGIDPDPRVEDNPFLDEGIQARSEALPFPDCAFDVVVANNLLEHLEDPPSTFREIHRVLKPGGVFLAKTPNRRHYVASVARSTPHWFHEWINRARGRSVEDTFPTLYRANTRAKLQQLGDLVGFEVATELVEGRPEYMRIHPILYLLGWVYERFVNTIPGLDAFRVVLLAELRKTPVLKDR